MRFNSRTILSPAFLRRYGVQVKIVKDGKHELCFDAVNDLVIDKTQYSSVAVRVEKLAIYCS